MITDVTGIVLIPGNMGRDCPGNGNNADIECCCDECDYFLCCLDAHCDEECKVCSERACPRVVGDP